MKGQKVAILLTVVLITGAFLGYYLRPFLDPSISDRKEPGIDCLQEIRHIRLPPGSVVQGGTTVQKAWRVRNCGTTTWKNYNLALVAFKVPNQGKEIVLRDYPTLIPELGPGKEGDLVVEIKIPNVPEEYLLWFQLSTADGRYQFAETIIFWVVVPEEKKT